MKKIYCGLLIILLAFVVVGCSSNKESNKELCESVNKIKTSDYKETGNYDDLAALLQSNYDKYCKKDSELCDEIINYINLAKSEIKHEDCSLKEDGLEKDLCELNNKMYVSDYKVQIDSMQEKMYDICYYKDKND